MKNIDLIVTGDLILTMDANRRVIHKGAIAVAKGVIVGMGEALSIKEQYKASVELDVGTDLILPGFINGHTHSPMTLLRGCSDDASLASWLTETIFPLEKALIDMTYFYNSSSNFF